MISSWEKIIEYGAVFITGLGVVFACGKNKQARVDDRKHIDNLNHNVFPDDPEREIIRQSDLDRQCKQIEKLFEIMEKNLIQKIELMLKNE